MKGITKINFIRMFFILVGAVLFSAPTAAFATIYSSVGTIKEIRTCNDSGNYLYIIELNNGWRAFNYHAHPTELTETASRKANFAMVLTAYQMQQPVLLGRYNSGLQKCGVDNLGELEEVIWNTDY